MLALMDRKMAGGINKNVKSPFDLGLGIRESLARQVACICGAQKSGQKRWLYSLLAIGMGQSVEISAPDDRARHTDLDMVLELTYLTGCELCGV
jgi:hypothetical protein